MFKRKWAFAVALVGALMLLSALPAMAQTYISYTVQPGDRLARIASRYCTTWQEIYSLNVHIIGGNPNLLYAGITITVPNRCGVGGVYDRGQRARAMGYVVNNHTYIVAHGDWLVSIAARFGVTQQSIVQANGLANPNRIFAGQGLRIPGLGGYAPPPVQPPYYPPPPTPPPYIPPPSVPAGCVLTPLTNFALYQTPDFTSAVVGALAAGQQVSVRNRTVDASGFQWYQVDTGSITGWLSATTMQVSLAGSCPVF
jgi:LysM repeat protein